MGTIDHRMPVARKKGGGVPIMAVYPEGASQSFEKGDPLKLSSGKVIVCETDDVSNIIGHAMRKATGTQDSEIPVAMAVPENEFLLNVYHSTPASAVTAITLVGGKYALYRDATNKRPYIDIGDTTNIAYQINSLSRVDEVGSTYGRVWASFLENVSALGYDKTS